MKNYTSFLLLLVGIPFPSMVSGNSMPESTTKTTEIIRCDTLSGKQDSSHIFIHYEEMPEFPGGDKELLKFIGETMQYPAEAVEKGIEGRVVCTFTINEDGSCSDIKAIRGINPLLDKEAVRILELMPKWKPGKMRNEVTKVRYTIPILFKLPIEEKEEETIQ